MTMLNRIASEDGYASNQAIFKISNVYPEEIETIRQREIPALKDTTYLDHAGSTLYPKSIIEAYATELTSHIFGNPHSASSASQLSSQRVEDIRLQALQFFNLNPADFDLVFVANATAAIKLVGDCLRDHEGGFWYGYHSDAHTSLVGLREIAGCGHHCFPDDAAVERWIDNVDETNIPTEGSVLFAYPGQSNMTGRRLPYEWCGRIRRYAHSSKQNLCTLFDAASLASTSPLNLGNAENAPDFTALSFYKIFGYPDLGALIVRKASAKLLRSRRYFAGGTVDMVSVQPNDVWHMKREILHTALEDGTLPFHTIIALGSALKAHRTLFGSMQNVATHTQALTEYLHRRMMSLRHGNNTPVCQMYGRAATDGPVSGPIIAFNILDETGRHVSNVEVEKLGIVNGIQFRTGGLCNPGGVMNHLSLSSEAMKANYAAGQRCGGERDLIDNKPTGVIRVSLGAMSSIGDVSKFVEFLTEYYVSRICTEPRGSTAEPTAGPSFSIESMSIFPIKSCSAFKIPSSIDWNVSVKGLAWDREWCLVHMGTYKALSQKQHPKMALLRPVIDLKSREMVVSFCEGSTCAKITIDLDEIPSALGALNTCQSFEQTQSMVCGESIPVHVYTLPEIKDFFSGVLGVPCSLARYFHSDVYERLVKLRKPQSYRSTSSEGLDVLPPIRLSNESPILLVSQSSVNRLNEHIQQYRAVPPKISPDSFRANIIISEATSNSKTESPYVEDAWHGLKIGSGSSVTTFDVLGPCQRCQMVCVDQASAKRRQEPFSTLAKTRRWDGGVWFGVHLGLSDRTEGGCTKLRVGDVVSPV